MTNNISELPNAINIDGLASSYAAGTHIHEHAHDMHQIVHAISGSLRVNVSGATWVVPPARALWVPANMPHSIECKGAVEMRTVYLRGDFPSARTDVTVMNVSSLMREVLVRLSENCKTAQTAPLVSLLLSEVATMTEERLHIPIPNDIRIARLVMAMIDNPTDPRTLSGWAKGLGFSERNLIRYIHAETGMSFRELRRQIRIILAIELLSDGHSVTNAALDVGYESVSAFIHAFRLVTGMTPKKYIP